MTRGLSSSVARGRDYEAAAERYLQGQGLTTVARNFRLRGGEIDLVMRDRDTLIFVEVRYRAQGALVSPLETITPAKQQRIVRTASAFLQAHPALASLPCRFDALALEGNDDGLRVDWIRGAFSA
ncbi:MAG: YraN family protein [Gammaproteobacteria bacterium]